MPGERYRLMWASSLGVVAIYPFPWCQKGFLRFMVFNVTFNNISVISWSVLLVEETGVPGDFDNDKLYHMVSGYTSPWIRVELTGVFIVHLFSMNILWKFLPDKCIALLCNNYLCFWHLKWNFCFLYPILNVVSLATGYLRHYVRIILQG